MVKTLKNVFLTLSLTLSIVDANVYEKNCVSCHNKLPVSIDKYFYKYLLIYSGERDMKYAIINYLKIPTKETTVMSDSFISKFGLKKKTTLSDTELKEAINIYWEKYKVFGKLK
ncbi:MAG: hypothetical protein JKY28_02905 [Sulfurimonas sp.]|nr:hypothetical protein [Sulfurimonas sp.]